MTSREVAQSFFHEFIIKPPWRPYPNYLPDLPAAVGEDRPRGENTLGISMHNSVAADSCRATSFSGESESDTDAGVSMNHRRGACVRTMSQAPDLAPHSCRSYQNSNRSYRILSGMPRIELCLDSTRVLSRLPDSQSKVELHREASHNLSRVSTTVIASRRGNSTALSPWLRWSARCRRIHRYWE